MSAKEITSSVETIEGEAEKMLEAARKRASQIVLKAKEEAGSILSTEVSLDEMKTERKQIIDEAEKKAKREIEDAKKKAADIRQNASKKTGKVVERIVSIVVGTEVK